MSSPFADSVYARPRLTHLVRHYDQQPLRAESYLSSLAEPSAAAVAAVAASQAATDARAPETPLATRDALTNNHDALLNFYDGISIDRGYEG